MTVSSTDSSKLVFFVPGIMGSSLFLNRKTDYGTRQTEKIWGNDIEENIRLFNANAKYLNPIDRNYIQAGEVIPYFENIRFPHLFLRWFPIPLVPVVYQSLMEFCTRSDGLNLTQGTNFFPFAYNWLADNRETANRLAAYIREQDQDKNCRFSFIGHSMGGIVIRLMLLNNPDIAQRTDLFFQIASPIKGSAKSYNSIRDYPTLNRFFDIGSRLCQTGRSRADLQTAIERCYSLYQLLPPPGIIALRDESGRQYSPLDRSLWHEDLYRYIDAAINVHEQLAQPLNPNINLKCVYSNQKWTITDYVVDPYDYRVKREVSDKARGDDTVTVASAIAYSQEDARILINTSPGDHMGICQNEQVYNELRNAWNSL